MGDGGSKIKQQQQQQYIFHDNPRAWNYSMQELLNQAQPQDTPQYSTGADELLATLFANNFADTQQQANNFYQQDRAAIGTGPLDFNQLAQQRTPTPSQQVPQSYVRSNIDLNQLYGQQGQQQQQSYPTQQPVQQQGRQGGVARSGRNNFNSAVQLVLRDEGGYVDFGNQYGGKTNFGIIKDTFDRAKGLGLTKASDITKLTRNDAIRIYDKMFWNQSMAPQLPDALGSIYFDAFIQSPRGGAEILQRAINRVAGRNLVKVDGKIGPQTINAANSLINNNDDLRRMINAFCDERDARFRRVNAGSSILPGLLNRVKNTRKWALGQVGGSSAPAQQQAPVQQQAQAPQVTPNPGYPVDFSQDYLQDVPPAKAFELYPNYADYEKADKREKYQALKRRYGGASY